MIGFVTGTGTDAGKTAVTRGLARAMRRRGRSVVAIKPFETGCDPEARDADALASAAGGVVPGPWYRARRPVAPWAATLAGEAPPEWDVIVEALAARASEVDVALVEGAGGVLVPVDAEHDVIDLATALGARVLLVAPDSLGVISAVATAMESLARRGLGAEVVLRSVAQPDPSAASNRAILEARLGAVVRAFPWVASADDEGLADAAEAAGLVDALLG